MKKTLFALAFAALAVPAFAQVGVDSQTQVDVQAGIGDVTSNTTLVLPNGNPITHNTQDVNYSGSYRVKGVPVNSAATSISSPAVWRCSTAGTGAAIQLKDFAASLALPGSEADICRKEFAMAIVNMLVDLKAKSPDAYYANQKIACTIDYIADALEGGSMQCAEADPNARANRWAREKAERNQAAAAMGKPVASLNTNQRAPWLSGG